MSGTNTCLDIARIKSLPSQSIDQEIQSSLIIALSTIHCRISDIINTAELQFHILIGKTSWYFSITGSPLSYGSQSSDGIFLHITTHGTKNLQLWWIITLFYISRPRSHQGHCSKSRLGSTTQQTDNLVGTMNMNQLTTFVNHLSPR